MNTYEMPEKEFNKILLRKFLLRNCKTKQLHKIRKTKHKHNEKFDK